MASDRDNVIYGNQIKDRTVTKAELDATSETEGYVLTVQANGSVDWEESAGGAGSGSTFKQTFVTGDLTSDKITITHNLDTEHPVVAVYDNSDNIMLPTEITYKTVNTIELNFTDMTPLTGTYKVRVLGSTGTTGTFNQSFTNSDLSSGVLTASHNLSAKYVLVRIYDNDDKIIGADEYTATDTNTLTIDLSTFGTITGTWNIVISTGGTGSGGGGSSIADADNDTKVETEKNSDEDKIRFTTNATERALLDENGLKLETGADVTEFSTDGTLADDSDDAVPTEKAVKTYVDGELAGVSADAVVKAITQNTHGFSVGDWLRHNGTIYVLAKADSASNAESIGVVSTVTDTNNFDLTTEGYVTGLSGLTAGEAHFLDESTAGDITATAPIGESEIVKPVLIADSTTSGYVANMRGSEVTGTTSWYQSFTNSDLTAGVLTVTHNLGHEFLVPTLWNNNKKKANPDDFELVDSNSMKVNLTSYGTITGTWTIVLLDIGTTNSSLASDLSLSGQTTEDIAIFDGSNWVAKGGIEKIEVSSITRDMTASSGNVAYTGYGFKPSYIEVKAVEPNNVWSWGASDGSTDRCTFIQNTFGGGSSDLTKCIHLEQSGGNHQHASVVSFDTNGFTLAWTKINSPTGFATVVITAYR